MELALQTLFVAIVPGIFLYHIMTINQNKASVKKLNVHTHAADGSIQGIRGWY